MVTAVLVNERIEAGRILLERLDSSGPTITAAFWAYLSDSPDWLLFLAAPVVEQIGPRETYLRIQAAIRALGTEPAFLKAPVELKDITVVSPRDALVQSLKHAVRTGPGIHGLRFTGSSFDGRFIEDLYIYRVL